MSNLYQDAILDAKALRASAMANAKAALEEAFEPKIQEMLRLKLSEELDEVEELEEEQVEEAKEGIEEEKDAVEEVKHDEVKEEYSEDGNMEENYDINEAELEEILAQLEELTATEADQPEMEEKKEVEMEEAEQLAENIEENLDEKEEEEEEEEEEEGETEEAEVVDDETKVIDITLGDLKQVLQSVMAGQADMGMPSDEADSEAEAEVTLEEILAELEAEGMEDAAHRDPGHEAGKQKPAYPELEEKKAKEDDDDKKKMEEELEEAKTTIEKMRQDLQEVNLLNAKYLYMNKLFKSKSLSESQKVKVINALDRATNVNEVKNTYETLKESFNETKKAQLKESIGFASQAAGVAPKANIVDADPFINRWQTLAGIKK